MNEAVGFVILICISLGAFFVCREIVCWYFKMNEVTALLKEIRDFLKRNAPVSIDEKQSRLRDGDGRK